MGSSIRAGNLYINRPTTGAIVLRQPFGGMGKSSVGPGIKAGGPNYVVPLMQFAEADEVHFCFHRKTRAKAPSQNTRPRFFVPPSIRPPRPELLQELHRAIVALATESQSTDEEFRRVLAAITSYERWAHDEFQSAHDHFRLLGEDNFRRYLPVEPLRIRIHPDDSLSEIFCRAAAARAVVVGPRSAPVPRRAGEWAHRRNARPTHRLLGRRDRVHRRGDHAARRPIRTGQVARVRYAAPDRVPEIVRLAAAEALQYVAERPYPLKVASNYCGTCVNKACRTCTIAMVIWAHESTNHATSPRDIRKRAGASPPPSLRSFTGSRSSQSHAFQFAPCSFAIKLTLSHVTSGARTPRLAAELTPAP